MTDTLTRFTGGPVRAAKALKRRIKQRLGLFDPLQILPFRSHGTQQRLFISGRVLEKKGVVYDTEEAAAASDATHSEYRMLQNLRASLRRLRSDEIPGARLAVRHAGVEHEIVTDEEGYFHTELRPSTPLQPGWHDVELELLESMAGSVGTQASAHVLVPTPEAEFGVISDVDDTIIHTNSGNRLRMVWTVLFNDARSRAAVPGVGAFYRALELGPDGRGQNPIFYVSRSGWNLYDLMDAFLDIHDIPRGPLFMTDLALLEPRSTALAGAGEDKHSRIRELLHTYPELPFVLIGDSGQRDPEIYAAVVDEHPGRIRAIYIHDVTAARRDRNVHAILRHCETKGVPALAFQTVEQAATHAAALALVADEHRDRPEARE